MTAADYNAEHAGRAGIVPSDVGAATWADVEGVERWQAAHGLVADGLFGPESVARFRRSRMDAPRRMFGTGDVYTAKHTHQRTRPVAAIVIHDTVSHTAKQAQATLDAHGYATHFFVDTDGTVYECMEPAVRWGAHCAGLNETSIGIDVVAILDPSFANTAEKERIVERPWSASKLKGKAVQYTPPQLVSLLQLVIDLCGHFAVPKRLPVALTGYGHKVSGLTSDYSGVIAHGQWSTKRWDGLFAAELLLAAGFEGTT